MSITAYIPSPNFSAAADYLSNSSSLAKVSNSVKLELYALFKCITVSKVPSNPRPSILDFAGRAKWDSWNSLGNQLGDEHDPRVLEERYLEIARSLGWDGAQRSWSTASDADSEDYEAGSSSGGGGMGVAVSAMPRPSPDPKDEGTLHAFALSGDTDGLLSFLNAHTDADINSRDEYGYTPLHLAADRGNAEVVKALLARGADTSIMDDEGFTAFTLAEVCDHQEVLEILRG